jgi:transcriptional regulator with XRE-family HTH domain
MATSRAAASPGAVPPSPAEPERPDESTAALRKQVANARRVSGRTLASVARRSGLSTAYISQIESGSANPTLRTLAQLAAGLECDLADLFGAGTNAADRRFEPRFTPLPLLASEPGYDGIWDVTAAGATKLQSRLVHGAAGDHAEMTSHLGEEIIVVLAGSCLLHVGGIAQQLSPGESCHLAAEDPHAITDTTDDALLLVILTEE